MKHFLLSCLLLFVVFTSNAQTITITDAESGSALEFVTVHSTSPIATVTTNALGQADITAFKGAERIEISMFGYKTVVQSYSQIEQSGFAVGLESSLVGLNVVVVSASRWSQNSSNIPQRIISVSEENTALQNPQTAADLLGTSGAVFIQKSQQGGGSPMIRGFATNRLVYTVDGVRMNTAIFRGGNLQNVISLDPFAMESAEVLFGPGSVVYGSDAIGGVMSFSTLVPELSLTDKTLVTGKAITRYSSANSEFTGHMDVNVGWKKWAFVTSFSANDFGDLKMGSNGPDEYLRPFYVQRQDSLDVVVTNDDPRMQRPSGYSQINMMQKLRFRPNEKWDFQYGFHYSETSDYSRYDRHIRYRSNGMPRYGEFAYGPQIWMMNNLQITHTASNKVYDQMIIRLARQYFEESRISRNFNNDSRERRIEKVDATSVNIDFAKALGKKNTLQYGLEYVSNAVTSIGWDDDIATGITVPGATRYPQSDWTSIAAFLTENFKVSEKFLISAGLRFNQYSMNCEFDTTFYPFPYTKADINNSALTGSLGFVYRPSEKWVITANAATAFRSPNVDDIGKVFDSEAGSVVVPNPDLEAEYAYSFDLGISKVFGESVKLDVNGYYTILQNAMVRRDFQLNGLDSIMYDGTLSQVQAIQNAAVANVYGVQLALEVKLSSGFGLQSQFNWQKGEEELDDATVSPSRHAAPWFGVSRLSYAKNNVTLQFYAQYSGAVTFENLPEEEKGKPEIYAKDEDGNLWSPSWYTLNFKVMYKFTEQLSVSGGIENMTDQRYRPYSSGLAGAGRNFIISLRANF